METLPEVLPTTGLHLLRVCFKLLYGRLLDVQGSELDKLNRNWIFIDWRSSDLGCYNRMRFGLFQWSISLRPRINSGDYQVIGLSQFVSPNS